MSFYLSIGPYLFLFTCLPVFHFSPLVLTSFTVFCLSLPFTCPLVYTTFVLVSFRFSLYFLIGPYRLFFFLSVCLCLYYITSFLIVNTFFQKSFNFFILFNFSLLFANFQKILTIFQSFMCLKRMTSHFRYTKKDRPGTHSPQRSSPILLLAHHAFPGLRSPLFQLFLSRNLLVLSSSR